MGAKKILWQVSCCNIKAAERKVQAGEILFPRPFRFQGLTIILLFAASLTNIISANTITVSSSKSWSTLTGGSGPGGLPGSADAVIVTSRSTLTIDVNNAVCASLTLGQNASQGYGTIIFNAGSQVTVSGVFTIRTSSGGTASTLTMTNGGTLACQSLSVTGTNTFTPGTGTIQLTATNTIPSTLFTSFNNLSITGGTTTISANTTLGGNLIIGSGAALSTGTSAFTLNIAGTTNLTGTITLSGTGAKIFTGDITLNSSSTWNESGAGAVSFGGSLSNSASTFTANSVAHNFTGTAEVISGSGTTAVPSVNMTGSYTNSGIFTVATALSGSGSLVNTGTLNIGGTSGITTLTASASGNTVNYFGAAQTVKPISYYNLILSGSGTKTITSVNSILGDLTLSGSVSATPSTGITIGGDVTIGSGTTFSAGSFTHQIYGNWTNNGTFTYSTSTISLTGLYQTISGTSAILFYNLAVNSTTGGSVSIFNNTTVNNSLVLANGLVYTNSNTITVISNVNSASNSSYVDGKLARRFTGTGSKTFPVGKGGNYRPLTVNFSSLSATSTITAEQIEATLPGVIPSGLDLNSSRYWTLSLTGAVSYNYTITLDGTGFTPASTNDLYILKGDGTSNSLISATYSSPNYTTTASLSTFGNFAICEKWVTWKGSTTNWSTASNWSRNSIPDAITEFTIPVTTNNPVMSGTTSFTLSSTGAMNIETGANLTLSSGASLTLENGSTVTTAGTGKIILASGSIYRNKGISQPLLQVQRIITGLKGWHMVSSPVSTTFTDVFASPAVTQGFTGSTFPTLQPNLLWWNEKDGGTPLESWRTPANLSDNISTGKGYFYYVFNGATKPSPLTGSYPDALPLTISANGAENFSASGTYSWTLTSTDRLTSSSSTTIDATAGKGWNLIGNPVASTLNWDVVSGWTKSNIDNTIYIWDPSANNGLGDYLYWNGTAGTLGSGNIPVFQAFWVHASTSSPVLSFNNDAKATITGTFRKGATTESVKIISNETSNKPIVVDLSADGLGMNSKSYITLSAEGIIGADPFDAYRLMPMSDTWLALYTNSSASLNSPLVINNLPLDTSLTLVIPVCLSASVQGQTAGGNVKLSWNIPTDWPSDMVIELHDQVQKKAVSMLTQKEYNIDMTSNNSNSALAINPLDFPSKTFTMPVSSKGGTSNAPLAIVIKKGNAGDGIVYEGLAPALLPPYPNPFSESTTIGFNLPVEAQVRIEAFDISGRLLEMIENQTYPAGINEIQWTKGNIKPGMIIIRLTSGITVSTQKAIVK